MGWPQDQQDLAGLAILAAQARSTARRGPVRPSALALIWPDPPVVAGRATFIGDLLLRAGLANVVPGSAGEWPRESFETLVAWHPPVLGRPETADNRTAFPGPPRGCLSGGEGGRFPVGPA